MMDGFYNFDFKITCHVCKTKLRLDCVFYQLITVAGERFKCPCCGSYQWVEPENDGVSVYIESGPSGGFAPNKERVEKIEIPGLKVERKMQNLSYGTQIVWNPVDWKKYEWFISTDSHLLQLLLIKVEEHFIFFEFRFEHRKASLIRVNLKKKLVEEIECYIPEDCRHQEATQVIIGLMPLKNEVPQLFEWKSGFTYYGPR